MIGIGSFHETGNLGFCANLREPNKGSIVP